MKSRISITLLFLLLFLLSASAFGSEMITLTAEERAFIDKHPVLFLGVDPTFLPYEFLDDTGKYQGITADYIDLIRKRTGLEMIVVDNLTWTEAYEQAVLGEIDVLPAVYRTPAREEHFLFSEGYYTVRRALFHRQDDPLNTLEDLQGKKVAVQRNSSHHSFLREDPGIELITYTTVPEALDALTAKEVDAFLGSLAPTGHLIREQGYTGITLSLIEGAEQSLHLAVRKDYPELVGILNKALDSITLEERLAIQQRWIGLAEDRDYSGLIRILWMVGAAVATVFLISLYWILRLRKEVARRRLAESDLRKAKEEAERANQVKSQFLARMSHEIRTPLNGIMGMGYVLKKTPLSDLQDGYTDRIIAAARTMLSIINDILDFSKIEAGEVRLEKIPMDLDEIIEQTTHLVATGIEEKGLYYAIHRDPEVPRFLIGDPGRLGQILLNLLGNAVKFTEEGSITFKIDLVTRTQEDCLLVFTIKDTGIGMTGKERDALFQPFTQADASITRRYGGTGLGLSIAKNLTEVMGGEIQVYSARDEGSTFRLQLPFAVDTDQELQCEQKARSPYFDHLQVTVLTDNAFYRDLLDSDLEALDLYARFLSDPRQVTDALEEKPCDLLIADLDALGGELQAFIRAHGFGEENRPKLMLFLSRDKVDRIAGLLEESVAFVLTKPIIPSVLYNGIMACFEKEILAIHDDRKVPRAKAKATAHPHTVLLVEDNQTNQLIVSSLLAEAGIKTIIASDGQEGLQQYSDHRASIDLVLMDLHMPVMNGYEATGHLRREDPDLPIVAMTADAVGDVADHCQEVGFTDYLAKPFEPDILIERVLGWIDREGKTTPPPDPLGPVLDEQKGLRLLGHNRRLYDRILMEFARENERTAETLDTCLSANDYRSAIEVTHKIKSSAASIGSDRMNHVAIELQAALEAEDSDAITDGHRAFNATLTALLERIEQILSNK